jgi:hypothetical protein
MDKILRKVLSSSASERSAAAPVTLGGCDYTSDRGGRLRDVAFSKMRHFRNRTSVRHQYGAFDRTGSGAPVAFVRRFIRVCCALRLLAYWLITWRMLLLVSPRMNVNGRSHQHSAQRKLKYGVAHRLVRVILFFWQALLLSHASFQMQSFKRYSINKPVSSLADDGMRRLLRHPNHALCSCTAADAACFFNVEASAAAPNTLLSGQLCEDSRAATAAPVTSYCSLASILPSDGQPALLV